MPASECGAAFQTRVIAVRLAAEDDFEGWRNTARQLSCAGVPPEAVMWQVAGGDRELFGETSPLPPSRARDLRVPRRFIELAQCAALHRDSERFALLYRLLVRLAARPGLMDDEADPLVRRVASLAKAVRRDMHKMRAFVRFREIEGHFIAWFEPVHHIVRANAGFFTRRFANMHWSIFSPELSLHWDGRTMREGPGADRSVWPGDDVLEPVWQAYYAAIFNPARLKVGAMLKEMPRRYWKNMPEAQMIAPLIANAQAREAAMTAPGVSPERRSVTLKSLRKEADQCRRCPLWKGANQCVFGEGPPNARLIIVGEQPGDEEDRTGHPFIGPAGQLLDRALAEAEIDRSQVYVTNAVKHFKFALRGKRRIHQSPNAGEIDMCRWWLEQEIDLIRPAATMMLGASAIRGVTGRTSAVGTSRGKLQPLAHGVGIASYHPAYILRQPDRSASDAAFADLVDDLRQGAAQSR